MDDPQLIDFERRSSITTVTDDTRTAGREYEGAIDQLIAKLFSYFQLSSGVENLLNATFY
jgi:hypothetical protein